jgi:hypothetical protein
MNASVYKCISNCVATPINASQPTTTQSCHTRWNSLLTDDDPTALWKAINWNGCIQNNEHTPEQPTDEEFKAHFESLLNSLPITRLTAGGRTYIPVTDDPIQQQEVHAALKALKPNKSGGASGIPPGVLKLLPPNWSIFLTNLFNIILTSGQYPREWSVAKLITLYKKGARALCDNYRGIALMDSFAKTYDVILNTRLGHWFQPDREQAGAQKGRGCIEHLLALRLLIDLARHKRHQLFLVFVDFSKAYDRVPRDAMLSALEDKGCGAIMIKAIAAAYSDTKMLLRSANISTSCGVRQGSPTSCLLFTLLANKLIRDLKEQCQPDGFLQWLHCLMLMDDTILLASSRASALQKIHILTAFCRTSGMKINDSKTKFMVIGGKADDHSPFEVDGLTITNTDCYTYLGSVITQDASIASSVKAHCRTKTAHVVKFEAFTRKNTDAPFPVKKKVFTAALVSAILYASETWITPGAWKEAAPLYASCVRSLLGVRKTTATDLCLIEADVPPLNVHIKRLQKKTLTRFIQTRAQMHDDPLMHALDLARRARTPCARYVDSLINYDPADDEAAFIDRVMTAERTKYATYRTLMNPSLLQHPIYSDPNTPEHKRLIFTKARLSSHNLAIEKGRWTRKPREERLCQCGAVQDELHIVAHCPETQTIRDQHPEARFSLPELFQHDDTGELIDVCYDIFKPFV